MYLIDTYDVIVVGAGHAGVKRLWLLPAWDAVRFLRRFHWTMWP